MLLSKSDQDSSLQIHFAPDEIISLLTFCRIFLVSPPHSHISCSEHKGNAFEATDKNVSFRQRISKTGTSSVVHHTYIVLSLENFAEQVLFYNLQDFPLHQFVFAMAQISLSPFYKSAEVFFPKLGIERSNSRTPTTT